MSPTKRRRINMMLNAYLTFHAKKFDQHCREVTSWLYLFEWARLGGQKSEVIHGR